MNYGKHFLVEAVTKDKRNLGNKKFVKSFMLNVVSVLSMTLIGKPEVHKFPYPGGGITGYCLIAESHISIHTWPEKNYFSLDVFSCRDFNEKKVEELVSRFFKLKYHYAQIVERGLSINFRT